MLKSTDSLEQFIILFFFYVFLVIQKKALKQVTQ